MEYSGSLVWLRSVSIKLVLACDQEPDVRVRRTQIIHSIAGHHQSCEEER